MHFQVWTLSMATGASTIAVLMRTYGKYFWINQVQMMFKPGWELFLRIWGLQKIRPHRFGGEGVLIGVQTATLNAQSHLLI